jgi:hypothetical protein
MSRMEGEWGLVWHWNLGTMIYHTTSCSNKELVLVFSFVCTALSENVFGHLRTNKLLIICSLIKVIPLHVSFLLAICLTLASIYKCVLYMLSL